MFEWLEIFGVFGVVELFVVEVFFIDVLVFIICGCIDDLGKIVIKFVNDNDDFFGICFLELYFLFISILYKILS